MKLLLSIIFLLISFNLKAAPVVDDVTELRKIAVSDVIYVARGLSEGKTCINKFGRSTNVDSGIATDIWDNATASDDQAIWTAPTQARTHTIFSTSLSDDGDTATDGARTLRISGLTSWNAKETSETVTMNGTGGVTTVNSYVIIHRASVLTSGALGPNAGDIAITADTDGTRTALIRAGEGQTQMAIYGIPSTQSLYITRFYGNVNKSGGASGAVDVKMLVNPEPGDNANTFLTKHTFGLITTGTSALTINYTVPKVVTGPAIIKIQASGSAADLDVSAGFDALVIDN